jgi:hypothetical protein
MNQDQRVMEYMKTNKNNIMNCSGPDSSDRRDMERSAGRVYLKDVLVIPISALLIL